MKIKVLIAIALILFIFNGCSSSETFGVSSTLNNLTTTSGVITSETVLIVSEPTSSAVASDKNEQPSSKKQTNSQKPTSSTKNSQQNNTSSRKEYWVSAKGLTFTEADIGKVVGYDPYVDKDITVTKLKEGYNGAGCKYIYLVLSNDTIPNEFTLVECGYCHEMPCPNGGGKKCSKYDIKLDGQITCQQCGKPNGNGYYGTCHGTIDWNNGGKITCNYYSNCLKCGKPVGDGYNGTCHVTWGKYSGETTCNHYD